MAGYHCMQFEGKIMNQTWENSKKPSFESNLGPFGKNLGQQFFCKTVASSVTRFSSQLSSCTISEKTDNPILIS